MGFFIPEPDSCILYAETTISNSGSTDGLRLERGYLSHYRMEEGKSIQKGKLHTFLNEGHVNIMNHYINSSTVIQNLTTFGCVNPTICCLWKHKDMLESTALETIWEAVIPRWASPVSGVSSSLACLEWRLPGLSLRGSWSHQKHPWTHQPLLCWLTALLFLMSEMLSGMSEHALCKFIFDLEALITPVHVYMTYKHLIGTWEENKKWYTHACACVFKQQLVGELDLSFSLILDSYMPYALLCFSVAAAMKTSATETRHKGIREQKYQMYLPFNSYFSRDVNLIWTPTWKAKQCLPPLSDCYFNQLFTKY